MSVNSTSGGLRYAHYIGIAIFYFIAFLIWAYYLGAFDQGDTALGIRIRNAAITMPLMTVFAYVSISFLLHKSIFSLKHIVDQSSGQKDTSKVLMSFYVNIKKLRVISVMCGATITLLYLYFEHLLALNLAPLSLFMNFSAALF